MTWWPSDLMLRLLEFVHVSSHFPWWGSIALLTVILRTTIFPVSLRQARNMAIMPYIKDEQSRMMEEMRKAREVGELGRMRQGMVNLGDLYRQWGYSPYVHFWGFLQIPIFFSMFRAMMRGSQFPIPGWETGGTLWFTDLTASDPYFILPMISGLTTFMTQLV